MILIQRPSKLFLSTFCVVWLGLAGDESAQSSAMCVTPANPTISVGQTQQFTASGAITPTEVSAGGEYTCVRLPDRTAPCTGRNQFGQHGNGTSTSSSTPVAVSGITSAVAVSGGGAHTCAVLSDGTVRCWGANDWGQFGNGSRTSSSTPVAMSP
jgi:alpha-tubulin suppressor-like RCC1 family protein